MDQNKSAVERAFELAKSGQFKLVADIKSQLSREGYSTDQITGRVLTNQLKDLAAAALSTVDEPR